MFNRMFSTKKVPFIPIVLCLVLLILIFSFSEKANAQQMYQGFNPINYNQTNLPIIQVDLRNTAVTVFGWETGTTITLNINDPATNQNPDCTRSQTTSWINIIFSFYPFPPWDCPALKAGSIVTAEGDNVSVSYTIKPINITTKDVVNDVIAGIADPNEQVILYFFSATLGTYNNLTTVSDANGNWAFDFSKLAPPVNLTLDDSNGNVTVFDAAGNSTIRKFNLMTPKVYVQTRSGMLDGFYFQPNELVTLRIHDPSAVNTPDYIAALNYPNDDGDGIGVRTVRFSVPLEWLKAGNVIQMSGSVYTVEFTLWDLSITSANTQNDIVYGKGSPGNCAEVYIRIPTSYMRLSDIFCLIPDNNGNWAADFRNALPGPPLDINGGMLVSAIQYVGKNAVWYLDWPVPLNEPPIANAGGPYAANEGSVVNLDGSQSYDPDGDPLTYAWDLDGDSEYDDATGATTSTSFPDNGTYNIGLQVTDNGGLGSTNNTTVLVRNMPPVVGAISVDINPVQINTPINTSVNFTDPGIFDTHYAVWYWGDGSYSSGIVTESNGTGSVTGSHIYHSVGLYVLRARVNGFDGGAGNRMFSYVVVYNPAGGFVTGGGWIGSLDEKAKFELDIRYLKGSQTPKGSLVFQVPDENITFFSSKFDWLVVKEAKAFFKGEGKLNGVGNYGFLVSVIDDGTPDLIRIKIWEKATGTVIYDNMPGMEDNADPITVLGGGSIAIHK